MTIELSPKVASLLEQVLSKGGYGDADEVLERALTEFLEQGEVGRHQLESIRRMAQAADDAGLYDLDLEVPISRHD